MLGLIAVRVALLYFANFNPEFQFGMLMGGTPETARAQANRAVSFQRDLAKIFIPEVDRTDDKVSCTNFLAQLSPLKRTPPIRRSNLTSRLPVECGED